MSDLRKRVQLLGSLEGAINAVQERSTSLHASISQRLKWAAGANPSLNAVLKKFDTAVNDRNRIYAVSKIYYPSYFLTISEENNTYNFQTS